MKEALKPTVVPLAVAVLLVLVLAAGGGMLRTLSAQSQEPLPPSATPTSLPTTTPTPEPTHTPSPEPDASPTPEPATTPDPEPTATPTPTHSNTTTATHRAQVDFGTPVSDSYLQTLLERYEAKLVNAYMTTAGFFGAHRTAEPTDPALFIARARGETVAGFSNGAGGGTTTRARDFVGTYTAQDVTAGVDVRKRAESLLRSHARLNAAGDAPLIHALEILGSEPQLLLLGAEKGVVGFEIAAIGSGVRWSRPPFTGVPTGQTPVTTSSADPRSDIDDARRLYEQLSTLAGREIESRE